MDVDNNELKKKGLGFNEIGQLGDFCQSRGIDFGIIFTDNTNTAASDYEYYTLLLDWAGDINAFMGMPEHVISQSWQDKPDYCFPESSNYSMLHATNALFIQYGHANNAQYLTNSIPAKMITNGKYTISVTFRNTGKSTWTKASGLCLMLISNQIWGTVKVDFSASDSIAPGQLKTFTFPVTAPSSPGLYACNWAIGTGTLYFTKPCKTTVSVEEGIYNGSFEEGSGADANGWAEATNHARNSEKRHDGSFSLKAVCIGTSSSTRSISFQIRPNTSYTFSAWFYNSLTAGSAYIDMNDMPGEVGLHSTRGKNQWEYKSIVWNSGSNTNMIIRCVTDGNPQGKVWFDDIRLVK